MIGKTISHYKILEKLGEGGMGVVYRAEDTKLNRIVAVKVLPPELAQDASARQRVMHEAQAASALQHNNICTIHEINETEDGGTFICMDYYEGRTLRERIAQGPLDANEVLDIVIQASEGLAHAHDRGIVHRDIKPENIMIAKDGSVRIMDFGLAKLTRGSTILKSGTVAGTLAYMSPEQVTGRHVDSRTDIWSLGAVLYELLTGRVPFEGEYEAALLYSLVNEKPKPPSEANVDLPLELEGLVLKALEKKPEQRYQSMQGMVEDLRGLRTKFGPTAERLMPPSSRRSRLKRSRTRLIVSALVGAAALVSVLLLVNLFSVNTDPIYVAVLDFENNTNEADFDRILAEFLITDLGQTENVRLLPRDRIQSLCQDMGFTTNDLSSGLRLARVLGIQTLVSGKVYKVGNTLRINANVYDVATENLWFTRRAQGEGLDSILDMIDDLSRDIRKGMRVIPIWGRDDEPALAEQTTKSIDAYRAYSREVEGRIRADADSLYSEGLSVRYQNPTRAVVSFERAVALDSTFVEAYLELALLYKYQLADYDKALQNARRAVKASKKDRTQTKYLKSLVYESWVKDDWDRVIEHMRAYLALQPNDMVAQRRLAWVLERRESTYEDAITQFNKVIELDPRNISGEVTHACNHLGNLYMYTGRFYEAIAAFERYRSLAPGSPAPLHSIGNAYLLSGRYEEAVNQYLQIIKAHPRYFISYESLGIAYMAMGRCQDALDAFKRYLAVVPPGYSPDAHIKLAGVYYVQKDFVLANDEADEALLLDNGSCGAHWSKGLIALATEGAAGAREELAAIEKLPENRNADKGSPYLHHLSGRIRLAEGEGRQGLEELRKAVEAASRDESYFFRKELVRGCLDAGFTDEAIREGRRLLDYNPNDGETLSLMGFAYEQRGDREKMTGYLERALKVWEEADEDFLPLKAIQEKL